MRSGATSFRTVMLLLLALVISLSAVAPVSADVATPAATSAGAEFLADTTVQSDFPVGLSIASTLAWDGEGDIARIDLLYTATGSDTATIASSQPYSGSGPLQTRVEMSINLQRHYLPVGIELSLWWRLVGTDGMTMAESNPVSAMWYDEAHDWNEISSDQIILLSYALSDDFAESSLAALQDTVDQLEARYGMTMPEPIRVWVYETYSDFQAAQPPNSREAVAALAFTGYHTIAAIVPDGNESELLRVLPHEITHQVLHQATNNAFTYVPMWFNEGMATHVQTGGTDGYMEMVVRAQERGELFRLDSLNAGFPFSPSQATLAYATSWSAFGYLEERWGDDGIGRFIDAIAAGLPYEPAIETAFGITADDLNTDWTAWVVAQGES